MPSAIDRSRGAVADAVDEQPVAEQREREPDHDQRDGRAVRRRGGPVGSVAPSRTAAIGGTCVALIAGAIVASRVTTIPSDSETITVRVSKTSAGLRQVEAQRAESARSSPFASADAEREPERPKRGRR